MSPPGWHRLFCPRRRHCAGFSSFYDFPTKFHFWFLTNVSIPASPKNHHHHLLISLINLWRHKAARSGMSCEKQATSFLSSLFSATKRGRGGRAWERGWRTLHTWKSNDCARKKLCRAFFKKKQLVTCHQANLFCGFREKTVTTGETRRLFGRSWFPSRKQWRPLFNSWCHDW